MITRILTAVIGIPLALSVIYQGGWLFLLLITVLALIGLSELANIFKHLEIPVLMPIAAPSTALIIIAFYFSAWWAVLFILTLVIIILAAVMLWNYPDSNTFFFGGTLSAILYITWIFGFTATLRGMDSGFGLLLFLILVIWGTDSGAYFTGYAIGKTPLAPQLSPKKTVEGSIGGIFVALVIGALFSTMIDLSLLITLGLALLTSIFAQLGDLFESMLKRKSEVKDSGNIIPGHGGILDRFDSFFLSAALFYFIVEYLMNSGL